MSRVHELKSWKPFFRAIVAGHRSHELRRADRDFSVGDVLLLREYDSGTSTYSGQECRALVTSITSSAHPCAMSTEALAPGFCIMSIRLIVPHS